jgi:hypothetical protein
MLFVILFIADWKIIGEHRQRLTDLNTDLENKGRIDYDYKVGQKILVRNNGIPQSTVPMAKRPMDNYDSPYEWNNHDSTRNKLERLNIRRVKPFEE